MDTLIIASVIIIDLLWMLYKKLFGISQTDTWKTLFDKHFYTIKKYSKEIRSNSYKPYYIENLTRDCINEICIAENKSSIQPRSRYLRDWKKTVSIEWSTLASEVEKYFQKTNQQLNELMTQINKTRADLNNLKSARIHPDKYKEITKLSGEGNIVLNDIDFILTIDSVTWRDKEIQLINNHLTSQCFPIFTSQISNNEVKNLNDEIEKYNRNIESDNAVYEYNKSYFKNIYEGFNRKQKDAVLKRIDFILNNIDFPDSFPKLWDSDYDPDQSIAIVEIALPDVVHKQTLKIVELKSGKTLKPLTKKETQEYVPQIHPAIILRVAYEIFRNDENEIIKLLVINGWVEYDAPATGNKTKTYTASLVANRNQILELNLSRLDPVTAFLNLKGKSAGKLIDIIPVTPTLSLDRKDKRFVETKEVIDNLGNETNLAAMDWQDFEMLITELFEKEFAEKNAEVKVTQSSRDRGVDAIVFDPDPIKGGKFVIQAKRYTKTVDVSSVRDLCAVVKKEGASRGILVTTSYYGADAYEFAKNEPVTLLKGSELLGLLEKHGYKFRINIEEARRLLKETENIS